MQTYILVLATFFTSQLAFSKDIIHQINCITLDDKYKPDGGSFTLQRNITNPADTKLPPIKEIKNVSFFKDFIAGVDDFQHVVCKRKGMEHSKDYANSYEICGFTLNMINKNKDSIVIQSSFNKDEDACSMELPNGFLHSVRSSLIKGFAEEERLRVELAEKKVGHVFYHDKYTRKTIQRIQCGTDSDNRVKIHGANR